MICKNEAIYQIEILSKSNLKSKISIFETYTIRLWVNTRSYANCIDLKRKVQNIFNIL